MISSYIQLLRVNHWFKNSLIFLGVFSALIFLKTSPNFYDILIKSVLGFFLASLVSSINYVINQITDMEFDRKHIEKKERPLPSGRVGIGNAIALALVLLVLISIAGLIFFNILFLVTLLIFLVAGVVYNIKPVRLKDVPYIDVIAESVNNPIRFLLGWFIVTSGSIPPAAVLVLTWTLGAVFMTAKRYDELKFFGKKLTVYRHTFETYTLKKLKSIIYSYSAISLMLIAYMEWRYVRSLLATWPLVLFFFLWLLHTIFSGKAKARLIEDFVLSKKFIIISSVLLVSHLLVLFLNK